MMRGIIIAGFAGIAALASGCRGAQPVQPVTAHLESGDSVEIVGWSIAVVPNEPQGLLLAYRPFAPMEDTLELKRIAVALWQGYARPVAEERHASWVVLQAQSRPVRKAGSFVVTHSSYGVVIDRMADGNWYFHRSGQPVD